MAAPVAISPRSHSRVFRSTTFAAGALAILLSAAGCCGWSPCLDECPKCKPPPECDPCAPDADCACRSKPVLPGYRGCHR